MTVTTANQVPAAGSSAVSSLYTLGQDDLRRVDRFRREKLSSVLVVMFTDIEGFTVMAEKHGDAHVMRLLDEHNEILIEAIERDNAGCYIKNIGDAILAVFTAPSAAVDRALEIQRKLARRNAQAPPQDVIKVRIGLHMGQVAHGDEMAQDVFGSQVNRSHRIVSIARGGQILMSETTYENARHWLVGAGYETVAWHHHGEWRLKGVSNPLVIYEAYDRSLWKARRPVKSKESRPIVHGIISKRSLIGILCAGCLLLVASWWQSDRHLYAVQLEKLQQVRDFSAPLLDGVLHGALLEEVAPADRTVERNAAFDYMRETDFFAEDERAADDASSSLLDLRIAESDVDHAALQRLNATFRKCFERFVDGQIYRFHVERALASIEEGEAVPAAPMLERLAAAARSATCAFVPGIVRPPEKLPYRRLSAIRATTIIRAMIGYAIHFQRAGEHERAEDMVQGAARLAYHLGAELYRYEDVALSIGLQQYAAGAAADLARQRGDLLRSLQWERLNLATLLALSDLRAKRRALAGEGRILASVAVQAAGHAATYDPLPFWRIEAAKELAYARSLWWNRRDKRLAETVIRLRAEAERDPYVKGFLRLLRDHDLNLHQCIRLIEQTDPRR